MIEAKHTKNDTQKRFTKIFKNAKKQFFLLGQGFAVVYTRSHTTCDKLTCNIQCIKQYLCIVR